MTVQIDPNPKASCERHRWSDERLHTFTPVGLVTVVVCSMCGAVRIRRQNIRQLEKRMPQ